MAKKRIRRISMETSESQRNNTLERSSLLRSLAQSIVSSKLWSTLSNDDLKAVYRAAWRRHLQIVGDCTHLTASRHIDVVIEAIEKKRSKKVAEGEGDSAED